MKDEKESIDLMDYQEYKRAWDKLQELRQKIDDAQIEYDHMLSTGVFDAVRKERELRVIEVLKGNDPDTIDIASTYKADLQKARTRLTMFQQAEVKQKEILNNIHLKVSKEIAKSVKPKYEAIIGDLCTQLCELGKIIIQEISLRESLNDNQISFTSIFTAMPTRLGDPRIYNSRISSFLIECCERGYFRSADIPKELKDFWEKRDGVKLDAI